jgi:hypothetical protein
VVGGIAAGSAVLVGFTGTSASAEPDPAVPAVPAPVTVTQTVTVTPTPAAAPAADAAAAATATPAAAPAATPAVAAPAATPASPAEPVAPTVAPLPPATSGTLDEFLKEKNVIAEPQKAAGFTALNIVLPLPPGWRVVPDPNVPNAFSVIADRQGGDALYTPNAQLMVYKLVGDFDPREAISHGFVNSQKLPAWQSTDASMAQFGGFDSSIIEGTYRENDQTLNTSRRHVIAQAGPDRYLLSLFVTTAANQVVATAAATDAIVNGFRVGVPTPAGEAPEPAASGPTPAPADPAVAAPAVAAPAVADPAVAAPAVAAPAVVASPATAAAAPAAAAPAATPPAAAPAAAAPAATPPAATPAAAAPAATPPATPTPATPAA